MVNKLEPVSLEKSTQGFRFDFLPNQKTESSCGHYSFEEVDRLSNTAAMALCKKVIKL